MVRQSSVLLIVYQSDPSPEVSVSHSVQKVLIAVSSATTSTLVVDADEIPQYIELSLIHI